MIWLLHDMIRCSSFRTMEYYTLGDWTVWNSNQFMPQHLELFEIQTSNQEQILQKLIDLMPQLNYYHLHHDFIIIVLILTSCRLCLFLALLYTRETFLWNRKWDLGLFWARWQYWKKWGAIISNFWGCFFMFLGPKKILLSQIF